MFTRLASRSPAFASKTYTHLHGLADLGGVLRSETLPHSSTLVSCHTAPGCLQGIFAQTMYTCRYLCTISTMSPDAEAMKALKATLRPGRVYFPAMQVPRRNAPVSHEDARNPLALTQLRMAPWVHLEKVISVTIDCSRNRCCILPVPRAEFSEPASLIVSECT